MPCFCGVNSRFQAREVFTGRRDERASRRPITLWESIIGASVLCASPSLRVRGAFQGCNVLLRLPEIKVQYEAYHVHGVCAEAAGTILIE